MISSIHITVYQGRNFSALQIVARKENQLSNSTATDQISTYWPLSRVYKSLDDRNASKKNLIKAKEIINQQAMIISNDEDRDCFINQVYLHKKILGELTS